MNLSRTIVAITVLGIALGQAIAGPTNGGPVAPGLRFDLTITLGQLVAILAFLVGGAAAYSRMMTRIAVLETTMVSTSKEVDRIHSALSRRWGPSEVHDDSG